MPVPTPDETRGQAVWLLDLTIGGQAFRFATRATSIVNDAGEPIQYALGLRETTWNLAATVWDASIGLEIEAAIDWARIVARGTPIERSPGILRRAFPGQTLERARTIIEGLVVNVDYGAADETLTITLSAQPVERSDVVPGPAQRVDSSTWPVDEASFDEKIEGAAYPLVVGAPGHNGAGAPLPVVPGLMVDFAGNRRQSKVAFSGFPVHATEIAAYDLTDNPTSDYPRDVLEATDLLGQHVSYFDFQGGGGFSQAADRQWYVGFNDSNRGILSDDNSGGVRGAGEAIRVLLSRFTGLPLDLGRMAAQADVLDGYLVDSHTMNPGPMWDWVTRSIVPMLPVLELWADGRLYYRWINWRAKQTDATAYLSADLKQIERTTPVRTLDGSIWNEFTIEFARFAGSTRYRNRRIITGESGQLSRIPGAVTDERILADQRCRQSQGMYGLKPLLVPLAHTWDEATAVRVGKDLAARFALPKRRIGYQGGPELEALEVGQVVLLTDGDLFVSDEVAIVWDIVIGGGPQVGLDLVLVDSPSLIRLTN